MHSKTLWNKQRYCRQLQNHVWIQNFPRSNWKITMLGKSPYFFVVLRYGRSCDKMCGAIFWVRKQDDSTTLQSINSMHWWPSFQRRSSEILGELSKVCCQIVLKYLYLTRIGRPDIRWSVNKLARSIAKWTNACGKRKSRMISYIHHTCEFKQYCQVWNTAKQCRLGLFQDSDFAGDQRIQNLHQVEHCAFLEVIPLFQSVGCARNKLQFRTVQQNQKSFPWTQDWGWMISPHLIHGIWSSQFLETRIRVIKHGETSLWTNVKFVQHLTQFKKRKQSHGMVNNLDNVDFVPSNVNSSHHEALLYVLEDNEAVIKMIIKGRSPTLRHVPRTHRVALNSLFDRINLDPKIQIKYIDTKNQLVDILTKGNFTRDEWHHLFWLFNISHFSSTNFSEVMSKRTQKYSEEERVTAKSKPMMNLVSRCSERTPHMLASTASKNPGWNQIWKSITSELVDWAACENGETC